MKKFKKEINIKVDVYRGELYILYNYTSDEIQQWVKKSNLSKHAKKRIIGFYKHNGTCDSGVCHRDGLRCVINIQHNKKVHEVFDTLSHEVNHYVFGLMKYVNIELADSSEEAFAYLNGYLMGEAYKKLIEPLIKYKNGNS